MKFNSAIIFTICTLTTTSLATQKPVLDTDGNPIESGVNYGIVSGDTEVEGDLGLTIVDYKNICPPYVGLKPQGISVKFKPFAEGETTIRETRDFSVTFETKTMCIQGNTWSIRGDEKIGKRFIVVGGDGDYFNIRNNNGVYHIVWCPTESCPACDRPRCGFAGISIENGISLLVLDGPAFPFKFSRV